MAFDVRLRVICKDDEIARPSIFESLAPHWLRRLLSAPAAANEPAPPTGEAKPPDSVGDCCELDSGCARTIDCGNCRLDCRAGRQSLPRSRAGDATAVGGRHAGARSAAGGGQWPRSGAGRSGRVDPAPVTVRRRIWCCAGRRWNGWCGSRIGRGYRPPALQALAVLRHQEAVAAIEKFGGRFTSPQLGRQLRLRPT